MTPTLKLLIDLIGIALFANWFTYWFTPLNKWREKSVDKLVNIMVTYRLWFLEYFILVFTCAHCLAFWAVLIYCQNFTYALIASFLAICFKIIIKYHNKFVE